MSNGNYDLIIIGSGAGGGTLAQARSSGKRILLLERGGLSAAREAELDPTEVFVKNRYVSKDTRGMTRTASRSSRVSITSSAARPRCMARRCSGCVSRISLLTAPPTA